MMRVPITLAGLALGATVALGGPDEVEAIFFPVAGPTTLTIDEWTGDEMCWSIEFEKLRKATPEFFAWQVTLPGGSQVYLQQYRPRVQTSASDPNYTTPQGFKGKFSNCAKLPRGAGHTFTLRAFSRYVVSHGLWTVPRRLGPFSIVNGKLVK